MVYPVSSPLQQSIPAANTFQPGGTEATKRPEENKTPDSTRPTGSDTARAQSSETRNNGRTEDSKSYDTSQSDDRYQDTGAISASSSRGTQLDVTA